MRHHFRYGPLFGYIVSAAIFTVMVYALLFQLRDNQIAGCERGNVLRAEFNERADAFDDILGVLIEARIGGDALARPKAKRANRAETRELVAVRSRVETVPIPDCEAVYPKPWPLG